MNKIFKFLIVACLLISQLIQAQERSTQLIDKPFEKAERVYIHYNSSFFLPGETLKYALYNLKEKNMETSEISKIAHVMLLDSEENIVFKHNLDLVAGAAYSDFLIPSSLATGSYKLVGYTNWMKNYEDPGVFMGDIYIINPYLKLEKDKVFAEVGMKEGSSTVLTQKASAPFDVKLNSDSVRKRENINLTLGLSEDDISKSRLSISIRKIDSTVIARPVSTVQLTNKNSGDFRFNSLPEYRGEHISGQILDLNDKPVNKKMNLTFSVPNRPDKFRIYSTDENGKFNFQVSDLVDFSTASLKVVAMDNQNYKVRRDSLKMDFGQMSFSKIPINQLNEERLSERIVHHQIEQYYASVKADSVLNYSSSNIFYGDKSTRYVLDDYTRFNTMNETFVEVINFVSFKNDGDQKIVKLSDFQNPNATGGIPLILVDGIAVTDHMDVYNLNPNTVESISVLVDKYYYGPAFYQGILDIRTKNSSYSDTDNSFELKLQPVERKKQYYSPEYITAKTEELSRVPDYRYQLLWIPRIESKNIDFYTSDITGEFEIRIEGFLQDGTPVSISKYLQVGEGLE